MMMRIDRYFPVLLALLLAGCGGVLNDPYPAAESSRSIYYSSFTERPKHFDPARAYSENEYAIIAQIYEPPLQYQYLKRPYTLVPLAASAMPQPVYQDANGHPLPASAPAAQIARSVYTIHIRPGMYYQPHPALARDTRGQLLYDHLSAPALAGIHTLNDFKQTGTREVVAADYVNEIKRLALPGLNSPVFGLMSGYIVGLDQLAGQLAQAQKKAAFVDLTQFPLAGAQVVDRYTYRITIKGKYPQFVYWLAMPFFAPVPPEADRFYAQPGLASKDISLDWYPLGSGPYYLAVNDPNRKMVLLKNPHFHGERFPSQGEPQDRAQGLLKDAGQPLPLTDEIVFSLEKESIPYWNKFLQGYYDSSGVGSDSFDQAIRLDANGNPVLTPEMQARHIRLSSAVTTSIFYMGFNMRDPVVGGYSERARKLRQAISIAVDDEEFISIFLNGRGVPAQGPLPPGIFGYQGGAAGINPYVYDWKNGRPERKSLAYARQLLAEAGYPQGRDTATGQPLTLYFDVTATGPDDKARLDWMRKQFQKLNIQLVVRDTDYNRFQDKIDRGTEQLFEWGWNADYPDPENFLFLLYGPNSKVEHHGENAANYDNPEFNRLFEQMKNMDNGPARQQVINQMLAIARQDAPWSFGYYPKTLGLRHAWIHNAKPNLMANNSLKYLRVDVPLRNRMRQQWNQAVWWPLGLILVLLAAATWPAVHVWRRREAATAREKATQTVAEEEMV